MATGNADGNVLLNWESERIWKETVLDNVVVLRVCRDPQICEHEFSVIGHLGMPTTTP